MWGLQVTCCFILYYLLSYVEEWIVQLLFYFISPVLMLTLSWHLSKYLKESFLHPLMKQVNASKKVIIITGCDSGFGLAFTRQLSSLGFTIFAGCYDAANSILKDENNPKIKVIQLDVTSPLSITQAHETIVNYLKENPSMSLHALINNAGILQTGLIEWESPDDISYFTKHMEVNCYGHIRMCKRFLPLLRSNGPGGRVINVNSMAARTVTAPVNAYAMSKAASASFTEAMQVEISQFGLHFVSVEPWIATTSLSAGDQIIDAATKSYEATPSDTQSAYSGSESLAIIRGWVNNAKSSFLNVTIDDVVDKVTDAVTSPDPEPVVRVCNPVYSFLFTLTNEILPWRLIVMFRRLTQYIVLKAA